MKKERKLTKILLILSSLMFVVSVSFTLAAYVNSESYVQNYNIKLSYEDQFDISSSNKNYKISTCDHLRNMARLVNMGCFDETDNFSLMNDITWDDVNKPLTPIGTMHCPFYSIFDGCGYKITNLNVTGYDLADVGMFGYVAKSATIKNFILDAPKVYSKTYESNFSYIGSSNNIDNNPLRSIFTPDVCRNITLTPTYVTSNNSKSGMLSFSINLPTVNNSKIINKSDYYIKFSDASAFSTSDNKLHTSTNKFDITFNKPADASIKNKYYTADIYVECFVTLDPNNKDVRFCRFMLEKFEFFYDGTNLVTNDLDAHCYSKTYFPLPKKGENLQGNSGYNISQHLIYAGIIAGSFDGNAHNILVYNPELNVSGRPFSSNSILIGRHYEDDNKSTISNELLNVDEAFSGVNTLQYKYEDQFLKDPNIAPANQNTSNSKFNSEIQIFQDYRYGGNNYKSPVFRIEDVTSNSYYAYGIGNRHIDGIYGDREGTFREISENTIRIYDTNDGSTYLNGDNGADASHNNVKHGVTLKTLPVYGEGNKKFLSINDDIECSMTYTTGNDDHYFSYGYQFVPVSNAIRIWTRAEAENKSWWQNLLDNPDKHILLNFSFDYLFFDENELSSANAKNAFSDVELKMYITKKQTTNTYNDGSWVDRTYKLIYDGSRNNSTYPSSSSWVGRDGLRYKPTIDWHDYAYYNNIFNRDPTKIITYANQFFALDFVETDGIHLATGGDPKPDVKIRSKNNANPLVFGKNEISGTKSSSNFQEGYKILNKSFSLDIKTSYLGAGFRDSTDRTPCIFLGLMSKDAVPYSYTTKTDAEGKEYLDTETPRVPVGGFEFDILKMYITFSDLEGNVLGTIATVDFGDKNANNTPTYDGSTWTNWPKDSDVKVGTNLFETFIPGQTAPSNDVKIKTNAQGITDYVIKVTRSSGVTVNYTITGATNTKGIIPFNNPGFTVATIKQG